jgi:hypothetical protein
VFTDTGSQLQSSVQAFATGADALGDFTRDTQPGSTRCVGETFVKAFGSSAKLGSAKKIVAPRVGEHVAAFRWVIRIGANVVYLDVVEFVRGSTVGGIFAASVGGAFQGVDILARVMDVRLQSRIA